ncbi:MogA/MoaB family molybdenum cofactor biosynthesis protein [Natribacillus halophilus]|uniref:Molybdenum cofactor biosynthesis protein B n=1 Tax=Natribacillus halophilus TaxID=549003 RepID=A0A1G8N1T7_9BACI|nr:MogA/MoaB family molybdenum cofactor biosynthesis protein [Natribacillus halophilus]SDI74113.1 molybdopterin adenylyltransferase [Natribacillus halophilus]
MHHERDASSVRAGILTMSDTRTKDDDKSGALICSYLEGHNHDISEYRVIKDDRDAIQSVLADWTSDDDLDVIITNGGTGISAKDVTHQVVAGMLEKEIEGFGELFRMKSYEEIGAKAMLSRALAGVIAQTAVYVLPGSSNAVRLGMNKLILPVLPHVVGELRK